MTKTFKQKKTLGLALGSGGWRGQAHIGVIKTLLEAGIKIDYIAGASAGALVGGSYCAVQNINLLEEIFREKISTKQLIRAFSDPSLKGGLIKGKKVTKMFENLFGKKQIEDLPIPFCAMASDLLTGAVVEINEGSLSNAIRASISVPFVFEPVKYKGYRLIDGATAVPIPVKTVKQMGADVVIAVSLYKNVFPVKTTAKINSLKAILKTSQVMLCHLAKYSSHEADLVLEPDIPESGVYSDPFSGFAKDEGTIEAGEEVAQANLAKIKQLLS